MIDIDFNEFISEKYYDKNEVYQKLRYKYKIKNEELKIYYEKFIEFKKINSLPLPIFDQNNNNFWYKKTKIINESIPQIEKITKRNILTFDKNIAGKIITETLIDEALNSSVIEGAFTTKKRTKELVNNNSKPKDTSEQMVLNNYYAMKYVFDSSEKKIDKEYIIKLFQIITKDTLDFAEDYRKESVYISNGIETVYEPPDYLKVDGYMKKLIDYINDDTDKTHPVIKSAIIHFYFVYIHPFLDGNGRTARSLSYAYLLRHGYEFFRIFSISRLLTKYRKSYYKALKQVEDNDSDLTYFIEFQLEKYLESIISVFEKYNKEYYKKILERYFEEYIKKFIISKNQNAQKRLNKYITKFQYRIKKSEYIKINKISESTFYNDIKYFEKCKVVISKRIENNEIYYDLILFDSLIDKLKQE